MYIYIEELIPSKERKINSRRCRDPGPALPAARLRTPGTHFSAYPLNHQKHKKTLIHPPKNAFSGGPELIPKWIPKWLKQAFCASRPPPRDPHMAFWAPRWSSRGPQNSFLGSQMAFQGPPEWLSGPPDGPAGPQRPNSWPRRSQNWTSTLSSGASQGNFAVNL